MDRREFLSTSSMSMIGVAGLSMFKGLSWLSVAAGGAADVNVVKGEVSKATQKAIEMLGGMSHFVSSGDKVVVKANLGFAAGPDSGTTTSPQMIRTVIDLALAAGAGEVVLLENPVMGMESCWKRSGAASSLAGLKKFRFVRLTDESTYRTVTVTRGKSLLQTQLAKDILDADVFINLPQAKSHSSTGVSLGLKNYMGLVYDRGYFHSNDLDQCIADVATLIPCDLVICDATRALLTGGPGGPGKVSKPGWVAAGTDVVAVDSYVTSSIPFYNRSTQGSSIGHIANAYQMGLGQMQAAKISVKVVEV